MVALPSCDFGALLTFSGSYLPPLPPRNGGVAGAAVKAGAGNSTDHAVASDWTSNAGWCAAEKWRVSLVPAGKALAPASIFDAMVLSRVQRRFQ